MMRIGLGSGILAAVLLTIRFGLVVPGALLVLVVLAICLVAFVVSRIDRAEQLEADRDNY